jgi:hypothetical protein
MRTSDGHRVMGQISLVDKSRLHSPQNVRIALHVWVVRHWLGVKAAQRGNHGLIAGGSIVIGQVSSRAITVPTPALVVGVDIKWLLARS